MAHRGRPWGCVYNLLQQRSRCRSWATDDANEQTRSRSRSSLALQCVDAGWECGGAALGAIPACSGCAHEVCQQKGAGWGNWQGSRNLHRFLLVPLGLGRRAWVAPTRNAKLFLPTSELSFAKLLATSRFSRFNLVQSTTHREHGVTASRSSHIIMHKYGKHAQFVMALPLLIHHTHTQACFFDTAPHFLFRDELGPR